LPDSHLHVGRVLVRPLDRSDRGDASSGRACIAAMSLVLAVAIPNMGVASFRHENGRCTASNTKPSAIRGQVSADVAGDSRVDAVSVTADLTAPRRCVFALRVSLADGRVLRARLFDPVLGLSDAARREPWPR